MSQLKNRYLSMQVVVVNEFGRLVKERQAMAAVMTSILQRVRLDITEGACAYLPLTCVLSFYLDDMRDWSL